MRCGNVKHSTVFRARSMRLPHHLVCLSDMAHHSSAPPERKRPISVRALRRNEPRRKGT
jgi:hypothetical protein